jgi:hypothetical protein
MPSSVPGFRGYQNKLIEDGMAIVERYGNPTFFLTMTIDPTCPEIQEELRPNETHDDRPDIVLRVFRQRYNELLKDIREGLLFGEQAIYILGVQKRGLLHCHIIFRIPGPQPVTPQEIDEFISAELHSVRQCPRGIMDPTADCDCEHHQLYALVAKYMQHKHSPHCGMISCH